MNLPVDALDFLGQPTPPPDAAEYQLRGEALLKQGKIPQAVGDLQTAALLYAARGEPLRAIALCQLILKYDPSHAETQKDLASLYARRRTTTQKMQLPAAPPPAPVAVGKVALARVEQGAPLPSIPLFSDLPRLAFIDVTQRARVRNVEAGQTIIEEGDEGDSMFAVVSGCVEVRRARADGEPQALAQLMEGAVFGEMALVSAAPRTASVVALEKTTLLELGRDAMQAVIKVYPSVGRILEKFYRERLIGSLLRSTTLFRLIPAEDRAVVAAGFKPRNVRKGAVLVEQGVPSDGLYVVLRGSCAVTRDEGAGRSIPVATLGEGAVFGEISLLFGGPATATVRAAASSIVLRLPRDAFMALILAQPRVKEALTQLGQQRREALEQSIRETGPAL